MNVVKFFLVSLLLFVGHSFADTSESSEVAKMSTASMPVGEMAHGYDPTRSNFGVSGRNQMLAKASYIASLVLSAVTLVLFFLARRNAKTNYNKAKKLFMIGLAFFALVIVSFLLPKLFLSMNFPGNFDMRAT